MTVTEPAARENTAGVHAGTTAISAVDPETGSLSYRGYPVRELCRRRSFEEVAYLLWHGELPTREQLTAQNRTERAQRALDPAVAAVLADLPVTAHPMDVLRTAVSLLGASDPAGHGDARAAVRAGGLRMFAALPAAVALDHRRRHGLGAVPPREDLGYAASFLYMTFGKVPEPQIVTAFETSLILYAEHGLDASAFAARVVASAPSDPCSAVVAAVGALKGPRHGGGEAVVAMMNEIAIPDNARPWLEQALAGKRVIRGFGDGGRPGDCRVPPMRTALGMVAALRDGQHLTAIYEELAAAVRETRDAAPDLDCPAGLAWHLIGFDAAMFPPVLAVARFPGWTAHVAEELAAGRLIRPSAAYNGPAERHLR